jgi:hypothetical protein
MAQLALKMIANIFASPSNTLVVDMGGDLL